MTYKSEDALARAVAICFIGLLGLVAVATTAVLAGCSYGQEKSPARVLPLTNGNVTRKANSVLLTGMHVRPTGPYTSAELRAMADGDGAVIGVTMEAPYPVLQSCDGEGIAFMVGGRELVAIDGGLRGQVIRSGVLEQIAVLVGEEGLVQLVMGPSLTIKACATVVTVDGDQMDTVRDFAAVALQGPWGVTL